jgi:hypothetical protein
MPKFRDSVKDVFHKVGVDITPFSCILVPVSNFSTVKRTTIKTRSGDSYDAAVFVIPVDRLGKAVQEVPFGEESFCNIPPTRTTVVQEANPRTRDTDVKQSRMILTWEQLLNLKKTLLHKKRPRKDVFLKALRDISPGQLLTETSSDQARRQYYAYANGPLDDTELLSIYDAGLSAGRDSTMDDIVKYLPDEIIKEPVYVRQAYNQWKAVTSARETD